MQVTPSTILPLPSTSQLSSQPQAQSPPQSNPSSTGMSSVLADDGPLSLIRTLRLGNGTVLTFTMADMADPSAVSFSRDIVRLNAMWDNSSPSWLGDSVLSIKGHLIMLKYWPEVYRYAHNRQWQGTKHKWGCWKDVVQRYRQGSSRGILGRVQ
ncbi:hypothetical protein BU15DRAFT_78880 [Melanogaster broomeanus]|nr:hypothetical protein BU15DRAFT_78880 [Melanogaster broomeanus]